MANVTISGMDTLIGQLEKFDLFDEQSEIELLEKAGSVIKNAIQQYMAADSYDIAKLTGKVKLSSRIRRNKYKEPYVTVYASGKNKHGAKYSEILFALNYGRSGRSGRGAVTGHYFWTKANKAAEKNLAPILEAFVEQKMREGGLL